MLKKLISFFGSGPKDMAVIQQQDMATLASEFIAATQQSLKLGEQLQTRLDAAKADIAATSQKVAESIKVG